MTKNFISLDVEQNGLGGKTYAVAMVVYRDGQIVDQICLSCPVEEPISDWLIQNPELRIVDGSTVCSYEEMLKQSTDFYKKYAQLDVDGISATKWGYPDYNATRVLYHCGMVCEGSFFNELVSNGLLGQFERPMAPIEVAEYLALVGEDPYSVDSYCDGYDLDKTEYPTHNPLADAIRAANAYLHIIDNHLHSEVV